MRLLGGFEQLRVVRRDHTGRAVAAQVALNAGLGVVTGGRGGFVQGFSKDDLIGDAVPELAGQSWAGNPGLKELPQALGEIATRVYAARAWKELERGRSESGWTREDMVAAARLPAEADAPVNPGVWRLVYENLSGQDELYRLQFHAGQLLLPVRAGGLDCLASRCLAASARGARQGLGPVRRNAGANQRASVVIDVSSHHGKPEGYRTAKLTLGFNLNASFF
jgi:hypothetical protein